MNHKMEAWLSAGGVTIKRCTMIISNNNIYPEDSSSVMTDFCQSFLPFKFIYDKMTRSVVTGSSCILSSLSFLTF